MRWRDLDGRRVLVWGLGREGRAALELLGDPARARPSSVDTFDDGAREVEQAERPRVDLRHVDVVIKAPGVSRYRPELVEFLRAGGVVTGLTDLVLAERNGRKAVGVTGTKGKSTTASLTAHLIAAAGVPVELAGNIGRPPIEVLDTDDRWIVLECSSYQCADVTVSPQIGVFTSLYAEHLDWHGSFERYAADKLNLFRASDVCFVNGTQPHLVALTDPLPHRVLVEPDDSLDLLGQLQLLGEHNRLNAQLALRAAAEAVGDMHPAFGPALASFRPLEHRLHTVGRWRGYTVVDDVLATAPEAVGHALDVFAGQPVTLLVGGYDRDIDYGPFGARLAGTRDLTVIAMGPAGERIATAVEAAGAPRPLAVSGLPAALAAVDPEGSGVLLLSPAATSYGEFKDFAERSRIFRQLLSDGGMVAS